MLVKGATGHKLLSEPVLIQFYDAIWRHQPLMSYAPIDDTMAVVGVLVW